MAEVKEPILTAQLGTICPLLEHLAQNAKIQLLPRRERETSGANCNQGVYARVEVFQQLYLLTLITDWVINQARAEGKSKIPVTAKVSCEGCDSLKKFMKSTKRVDLREIIELNLEI